MMMLAAQADDPDYGADMKDGDHPTPDNMSDLGLTCGWLCGTWSVLAGGLYIFSIYVMAGPLSAWAKGNFFLLSSTVATTI